MADETRRPGESFLAHRARLKAERQRSASAPPAAPAAADEATETSEAAAPPARQLTDADMPPVESLTAESDFSQFLAEGVSDALRQAALRKLFHLPQFNVLDGLNDYDDDYTKFEKLGEVLTYHQRRMQAREAAEREAEAGPQDTSPRQRADTAPTSPSTPGEAETDETVAHPASEAVDGAVEDDGDLQA